MLSDDPEIKVAGDVVHVVYTDQGQDDANLRRLMYRRSTRAGQGFESPVILQEHPGLDFGIGRFRRLAVDGTAVHIVSVHAPIWTGGDWYYSLDYFRSTNAGASFEPRRSLATGPAAYHLRMPHIVAGDGKVAIAYLYYPNWFTDSHLNLLQSDDGGTTFRGETLSRSSKEAYDLWDFQRDGDHLALAVVASTGIPGSYASTFRLLVGASSDAGGAWHFNQVCSTNSAGWPMVDSLSDYHEKPDLAWAGEHLYVTWTGQDTGSVRQTFVARSTDAGATFGPQQNLSGGQTGSPQYGQATVAARGRHAYVVWNVPGSGIWLRHSVDAGASWSGARRLFGGWWPQVAIDPSSEDGSGVHFLATPGLYRRSHDGTASIVGAVNLTTIWSWWNNGVHTFTWGIGPGSVVHVAFPGVQYPTPSSDYDLHYRRLDPAAPALSDDDRCLVLAASHEELHYENLQIPAGPAHAFDTALTVELWLRPDAGCPNESTVLFREHSEDYRGALRLQTHSWNGRRPSGKVLTTQGLVEVWGGELLADGAWHHLALSYDAALKVDNLRLYVDGHLSAVATGSGPCSPSPESFYVGGGAGGVYQTFRGAVDEVRLWNRALDEGEIRSRTTVRVRTPLPGLVACYPLDGSAREVSGSGFDGVLMYREGFAGGTPAPLPAFLSPWLAQGAVSQPFIHEMVADWTTGFSAVGLPPGVRLDPVEGTLSGLPSVAGVYDATVTATNRHGATARTLRILVGGDDPVVFRDDFTSGLAAGWDPLPAETNYYRVTTGGQLLLRANYGDTWQHYNRPLNLFSVPAPISGDWSATLVVSRYEPTPRNYNSIHVVAWDDTDNNVRLTYSYGDGRNVSLSGENAQIMESVGEARDFGNAPFLLRLSKQGDRYLGTWSTNGVDFLPVSTNRVRMGDGSPARIGFWMGIDPSEANVAWLDSFEVVAAATSGPRVSLAWEAGGLKLAWPADAAGADVAEVSEDLVHWRAYDGSTVRNGDQVEARVPASEARRFFRIRKP